MQSLGSCKQFGKMYKAGTGREPSPTSGAAAAHPNDTGPAAAEEAARETIHPAATGASIHTGPAQAASC